MTTDEWLAFLGERKPAHEYFDQEVSPSLSQSSQGMDGPQCKSVRMKSDTSNIRYASSTKSRESSDHPEESASGSLSLLSVRAGRQLRPRTMKGKVKKRA